MNALNRIYIKKKPSLAIVSDDSSSDGNEATEVHAISFKKKQKKNKNKKVSKNSTGICPHFQKNDLYGHINIITAVRNKPNANLQ